MYMYICNYRNIKLENKYIKLLNEKELKKMKSFFKQEDRKRYFVEIILLKSIISNINKIKFNDIIIENGIYGKPYLKNNLNFKFNISHSNEIIIIVIDYNNEVGIDIEYIKEINLNEYINILREEEKVEIISEKESNKLDKFYEIWTIKESFFKEEGKGISMIDDYYFIDLKKKIIKYNKKVLEYKIVNYHKYKISICSSKIDSKLFINLIDSNTLKKMIGSDKI